MPYDCDVCGETFKTKTRLRLHECSGPVGDKGWTVLSNWEMAEGLTDREMAEALLPRLREEMTEEEYEVDFASDLRSVVVQSVIEELAANIEGADWYGMGFDDPADYLDAADVSSAIGDQAEYYFKDDQMGKSSQILQVIIEYGKEYDLVTEGPSTPDERSS